jgi:hypothetical protein
VRALLRVSTRGGKTLAYDLLSADGKEAWARDRSQASFQAEVSALSIDTDAGSRTLSAPVGFRVYLFDAEVVGRNGSGPAVIRLWCHADDVKTTLVHHLTNGVVRTSVERGARMRWTPDGGAARSISAENRDALGRLGE